MACVIHTNLYDDSILIKMQKDLTKKIESGNPQYSKETKIIYVFSVNEQVESRPCNIPFNYGLQLVAKNNVQIDRPTRKMLKPMSQPFTGSLRVEQKLCRDQALNILLTSKSVMISCYTGFGKTVTAINMATKIKFKTLISVPKKALLKQWETEIATFVPAATVQIIDPSKISNLEPNTIPDFCIINSCNIHKLPETFRKEYGLVIVDEAHLQMTERLSENLLCLTPRYLVGITATPYREDGYNVLFNLFFGSEKVVYSLNKKHIVYKVKTGFVPDAKKTMGPNYQSKIDWNGILDEQSKDVKRNKIIVDIVLRFKERVFLILVKRVEHGNYLLKQLEQHGESVTSLLGKQQVFDKGARILIGTNSKIGTGFDHPRLDTLLCACDMVAYYIQFIGRVMRRKDVEPVIFDLVDSHPTLVRHFKNREKVYLKHGGEILKYSTNT